MINGICVTSFQSYSSLAQRRTQNFEWGWALRNFVANCLAPHPNFWRPTPYWQMGGAPKVQVGRLIFIVFFLPMN